MEHGLGTLVKVLVTDRQMSLKLPPAFAKGGDNYLMQTQFFILRVQHNYIIYRRSYNLNAVTRVSVLKMNGPFAHDDVRATIVTGFSGDQATRSHCCIRLVHGASIISKKLSPNVLLLK